MTDDIIHKETENFKIELKQPRITGKGIYAKVEADYKGNDFPPYDAEVKMTGTSVSGYAGDIIDMNGLTENSDELRVEIKKAVLPEKKQLREIAKRKEGEDDSEDVPQTSSALDKLLKTIFVEEKPKVDELEDGDHPEVRRLCEENEDLILRSSGKLVLTEKGTKKAKEALGFDKFEGDVQEEAEKQLEDNPLNYYLQAFNKVHKGDPLLKIWQLESAVSSVLDERQIHSWGAGPSGKGKSHINRNTLKFIPEEYYAKKNSISPKSMLYKADKQGTDFLNNQIIFFDEVDDIDEETVVLLRSMTDQDEDIIEHEMVRDQNFEKLVLETGSVTVWFTSVETINDEQLKNRFIITNPDGSADLDNQVFNHQMKRLHKGKELDFVPKEAPVVKEMVKDIMQETRDYKVIIPFRTVWKQKFNRRLYPYFVTSIRMITKLHYRNREIRDDKIFATKGDFKLAALVWERLVDTTVAQQDREALRLLENLPESSENAMSSAELSMRVDGFSSGKVRRKAKQLQETEELNLINTTREGGRYQYWAGEDKQKLVDNEPEIEINEDIVEEMLPEDYKDDEDVKDSVLNTEIEVYDMLLEKFEEAQERRNLSEEEVEVELTDDEEYLISQCKEYDWDATVGTIEKMSPDLDDAWEPIESLEQKGLIRLDEEEKGELKPRPTSKMDKLKEQQSVGL